MKQSLLIFSVVFVALSAQAFSKKELGLAYNKIGKASQNRHTIDESLDLVVEMAETTGTSLDQSTDAFILLLTPMGYDFGSQTILREILQSSFVAGAYSVLSDSITVLKEVQSLNARTAADYFYRIFPTVMKGAETNKDIGSAFSVFLNLADIHITAGDRSYDSSTKNRIVEDFKSIYEID